MNFFNIFLTNLIYRTYHLTEDKGPKDKHFGQGAMFFLFGAISAYFWLVRLLPTSRKLDVEGNNVKVILQDVRKDTQSMWLDAAFYYGVMNVSSKLYLEITIFFFVAMYQSNINKHM